MVACSPPAAGVAQVEVIFKLGNQIVENVFHYNTGVEATISPTDLLAIANAVDAQVHIGPWMGAGAGLVYQRTQARDLTPGTGGDVQISSAHAGFSGPTTGNMHPNNVTLAVSLHTTQGGRSGRGRFYLPGLTDSDQVDSNTKQAVWLNAVVAATNAFFSAVEGAIGHGHFVVLSRWHNKVCRPTAVWNQIVSVSADSTLDSQRRRLPGRGK